MLTLGVTCVCSRSVGSEMYEDILHIIQLVSTSEEGVQAMSQYSPPRTVYHIPVLHQVLLFVVALWKMRPLTWP